MLRYRLYGHFNRTKRNFLQLKPRHRGHKPGENMMNTKRFFMAFLRDSHNPKDIDIIKRMAADGFTPAIQNLKFRAREAARPKFREGRNIFGRPIMRFRRRGSAPGVRRMPSYR